MRDIISLKEFLLETRHGLKNWAETFDVDLEQVYSLEQWAWLLQVMKQTPDFEDYFPKGKWATVQRLEDLLEEAAMDYINGQ